MPIRSKNNFRNIFGFLICLLLLLGVCPTTLLVWGLKSVEDLLEFDSNGNLKDNVLLVRKENAKFVETYKNEHRKVIIVEDDEMLPNEVQFACAWKGTPKTYVLDSARKYYNDNVDKKKKITQKKFTEWMTNRCDFIEMGFISYFKEELKIYSVSNEENAPNKFEKPLKTGERNTAWVYTSLGRTYEVVGRNYKQKFIALTPSIWPVGEIPDYTKLQVQMSDAERVARVQTEMKRANAVTRVFTDVGFKKVKCPRGLYGEILTYWNNNKDHRPREEWVGASFFVNWNEVNQDLTPPPFILKKEWQDQMRPVIEEWTNTKLEETDVYGLRTYYEKAWLMLHVDREETHAASAILNVEQVGMEEEWEVHIYSNDQQRHIVSLQPGELLLYESAHCFHGRPVPLKGKEYTNMFFHYRPVGNPTWMRDSSVGMAEPVPKFWKLENAFRDDVGLVGASALKKWGKQSRKTHSEL